MSFFKDPNKVRVVITGIGTLNPLGTKLEEFWENLANGKSGVRLAQHVDLSDHKIKIAAEIDLPDVSGYFDSPKMQSRYGRFITLGYISGCIAIEDSGLDIEKSPQRYGSIIGSGSAGLTAHYDNIVNITAKGMKYVSTMYAINGIPNTCSGLLAKEYNMQGLSYAVCSACAAGNHSFGNAVLAIKTGLADAVFTGASESQINRAAFAAFTKIFSLSRYKDNPEHASRPFDKDRDGFVVGEGAAVFCLEELEHAKKRGAKIYGEITGFGFSTDAYDLISPHPEGRGAVQSMTQAIQMAGLNIDDIDYINCHATSTKIGDAAEAKAINKLFKEKSSIIPVSSTKSMIGHMIGSAGAVELAACIHTLKTGIIHPTINVFNQDPEINLNIIKKTEEHNNIRNILSNSFGFGGQNASIIISRYEG